MPKTKKPPTRRNVTRQSLANAYNAAIAGIDAIYQKTDPWEREEVLYELFYARRNLIRALGINQADLSLEGKTNPHEDMYKIDSPILHFYERVKGYPEATIHGIIGRFSTFHKAVLFYLECTWRSFVDTDLPEDATARDLKPLWVQLRARNSFSRASTGKASDWKCDLTTEYKRGIAALEVPDRADLEPSANNPHVLVAQRKILLTGVQRDIYDELSMRSYTAEALCERFAKIRAKQRGYSLSNLKIALAVLKEHGLIDNLNDHEGYFRTDKTPIPATA
jgi:hypothetical protein